MFAGVGGVWGAVIGYAAGFVLDLIFDEDPEAFTDVLFSDFTGRLAVGATTSADGGEAALSRAGAAAFADFINEFLDVAQSQDNNLDSIANAMDFVLGHYEANFRNGDGQNYSDFKTAIEARIVDVLEQLQLNDGDVKFATALTYLVNEAQGSNASDILHEVSTRMQVAADYQAYLENKEVYDALIDADPQSTFAASWATTFMLAREYGFAEDFSVTGTDASGIHITSSGNDFVDAQGGDDEIHTYMGDDTLRGGLGNDALYGGSGDDDIDGQQGDDTIYGGGGDNLLRGGWGIDEFFVGNGDGNDTIYGDGDVDLVTFIGSSGNYSFSRTDNIITRVTNRSDGSHTYIDGVEFLLFDNEVVVNDPNYDNYLTGTQEDDLINGTSLRDAINGGAGDDTIYGFDGNDFLSGDLGDDQLFGGNGNDWIFGGLGNDVVMAGSGNDRTDGGGDGDYIWGEGGADTIFGANGDDVIEAGSGNDSVGAGTGDDLIEGNSGNDTIAGNSGDDDIFGGGGNDTIYGGDGDDEIDGGDLGDSIEGGSGDDIIAGAHGWDTIFGQNGDDVIYGGDGNDQIIGGHGDDTVYGGEGNDRIFAVRRSDPATPFNYNTSFSADGGGAAHYNDHSGNEVAYGEGGNDQITLSNSDIGFGGSGDDTFYVTGTQFRVDGGTGSNDRIISEATNNYDAIWYRSTSGQTGAYLWYTPNGAHPNQYAYSLITNVEYIQMTNGVVLEEGYSFTDDGTGQASQQSPHDYGFTDISDTEFDAIFSETAFLSRRFHDAVRDDVNIDPPRSGWETLSSGDDIINDSVENVVTAGANRIRADSGNDSIESGGGADQVQGQGGNDTLKGGSGNDTLEGNNGNDRLSGNSGDDFIQAGSGYDTVWGGSGDDTIAGNDGEDSIDGESGHDQLYGGLHDDTIYGGSGRDTIAGGDGLDSLFGGDAPDTINGDAGRDYIDGGDGGDVIDGGEDDDTIYGGLGVDSISGSTGYDEIHGGDAQDLLQGDGGNDTLYGDASHDNLFGGTHEDLLFGGTGNDNLQGGDGNDTLSGDEGSDLLDGNAGTDLVTYEYASSGVQLDLEASRGVSGDAEGDSFLNIEVFAGSNYADLFLGGVQADSIQGLDGDDTIRGNAGNDTVAAGLGNDSVSGGDGDDYLAGNDGADLISGDAGDDTLLGGNGEDNLLGGLGADVFWGQDGNDILTGNEGNDRLNGQNGDDFLNGGAGNDVLSGGDGNDRFLFGATFGNDTITDFQIGTDRLVLENGLYLVQYSDTANGARATFADGSSITFNGLVADQLIGTNIFESGAGQAYLLVEGEAGAGRIYGSSGADWLQGTSGNDEFSGANGNDIYLDGAGSDRLIGGNGADTFVMSYDGDEDRISDFSAAGDRINLTAWGVHSLAALDIWVEYDSSGQWKGRGYIDYFDERIRVDGLDETMLADLTIQNFMLSGVNPYSSADFGYNRVELIAGQGRVYGLDGDDRMIGSDGNDDMRGEKGNDYLIDGAGSDVLGGGQGDDIFVMVADGTSDRISDFDASEDRIDLSAWGVNSIAALDIWVEYDASTGDWKGRGYIDYYGESIRIDGMDEAMAAQITNANFIFEGEPLFQGIVAAYQRIDAPAAGGSVNGTSADERVVGSDLADVLNGGGGNDVIVDGGGADMLQGGAGDDTFVLGLDEEVDSVADFVPGEDIFDLTAWGVEALTHLDIRAEYDSGDNWTGWGIIEYEAEIVRVQGLDQTAINQLTGSSFILHGASGPESSTLSYSRFEGLATGGLVEGTGYADRMVGGAANDDLRGANGDDVLLDGIGADRLTGGNNADLFVMARDGDSDRISDFTIGTDRIDLRDWVVTSLSELSMWEDFDGNGVSRGRGYIEYGDESIRMDGFSQADFNALTDADFIFADLALVNILETDGRIYGGDGSDKMVGSAANDDFRGEKGDDYLIDGAGADVMTGGQGADVFYLVTDGSQERLTDFDLAMDVIDIREWGAASLADLTLTAQYNSDGTPKGRSIVSYGSESIRLDGFDQAMLDQLTEDHFVFSAEEVVYGNWL